MLRIDNIVTRFISHWGF